MKIFLLALAFLVGLTNGVRAQEAASPAGSPAVTVPAGAGTNSSGMKSLPSGMPAGMKGAYESVESTIEKIYAAERDGFHSTAYVVKWHDQEVVVPDMFATGDKKVGDKITFMVQEIEMPLMGKSLKVLQFMAVDPAAIMKLQGAMAPAASASPSATSTPQ